MQFNFDSAYFGSAIDYLLNALGILSFYILILTQNFSRIQSSAVTKHESSFAEWLKILSRKKALISWHQQANKLMDKAFGEKILSSKAMIRISFQSYLISVITFLTLILLAGIPEYATRSGASIINIIAMPFVASIGIVSATFIADIICVSLCRIVMRRIENTTLLKSIGGIILVFITCIIFGFASVALKNVHLKIGKGAIGTFDEGATINYAVASVQYAVAFITTFSVVFWILLFLILRIASSIAQKYFSIIGIPGKINWIVNYPFRFLALLALTGILVLLAMSSFGFEAQEESLSLSHVSFLIGR